VLSRKIEGKGIGSSGKFLDRVARESFAEEAIFEQRPRKTLFGVKFKQRNCKGPEVGTCWGYSRNPER
jgi:hypothetical protein